MQRNRKSGVAIVIVLGLIAVLTLAAVAFSISMRVERKGASNFKDSVQARHMLWSALANAVERINDSLDPTNGVFRLYPEWDMMVVPNPDYWPRRARVLTSSAVLNIPSNMIAKAQNTNSYWNAIWATTTAGPQVWGRYSFIALNESGLLDVNRVGGEKDHGAGASPREMQIGQLPEFIKSGDEDAFLKLRDQHLRYETLSEHVWLDWGGSPYPSSFDVYSLSIDDTLMQANMTPVKKAYVGAQTNRWVKADIMAALKQCVIRDKDASLRYSVVGLAYTNLLDLVDGDSMPCAFPAPDGETEAFPMINEVILTIGSLKVETNGDYEADGEVETEWFYPFEQKCSDSFKMDCLVKVGPATNTVTSNPIQPTGFGYGTVLNEDLKWTGKAPVAGSMATVTLTTEAKAKVYLASDQSKIVDSVPGKFSNPGITLTIVTNVAVGTTLDTEMHDWAECFDPRFNSDPTIEEEWLVGKSARDDWKGDHPTYTAVPTPNNQNNWVTSVFSDPSAFGKLYDNDVHLYVPNKPLPSAGHMGYLTLGPWYSIRLYDHQVANTYGNPRFHSVYDYFTVNATNRGLVNVNTTNIPALQAVFFETPEKEYEAAPTRMTAKQSKDLATRIAMMGPYRSFSNMVSVVNWTNYVSGTSEIAREAPLRDAGGLLTIRENLFTIFLAADSYSPGIGGDPRVGSTLASAHAVAQVWRDPYPVYAGAKPVVDQNGRRVHRYLIRYFKILDE